MEFSDYPQPLDYIYNDQNKTIQFNCDPGYTGGGTLSCDPDAQEYRLTSGSLCKPLSCATTSVENSNFSETGTIKGSTGDVVNVECKPGHWGGAAMGMPSE